jgi:hypothetical protein
MLNKLNLEKYQLLEVWQIHDVRHFQVKVNDVYLNIFQIEIKIFQIKRKD